MNQLSKLKFMVYLFLCLIPSGNSILITEMADLFPDKMFSTGYEVNFQLLGGNWGWSTPAAGFSSSSCNHGGDVNRKFVVWEESFTKYNLSQTAALKLSLKATFCCYGILHKQSPILLNWPL